MRVLMLLAAFAALSLRAADAELSRRLFDFTPVSVNNPAVAVIDDIAIPVSELRAYQRAEHANAWSDHPTLAEKRTVLDALVGEYLLVDEAYRTGVTKLPGFVRQMDATRTMVLTDFLAARAQASEAAPAGDAAAELGDRLFESANIDVSNEAYDLVKQAGLRIDAVVAAAHRGPVNIPPEQTRGELRQILDTTPDVPVVHYADHTISSRQILAIYAAAPPPKPQLGTHDGFIALVKPLIVPELMALEAAKQGIAREPAFQEKLTQNQNTLLRFHMHGLIEREANARMKAPDVDAQLHAWYRAHCSDYVIPAGAGPARVPGFAEVARRVEADYSVALIEQLKADKIAALRRDRHITVNDAALE